VYSILKSVKNFQEKFCPHDMSAMRQTRCHIIKFTYFIIQYINPLGKKLKLFVNIMFIQFQNDIYKKKINIFTYSLFIVTNFQIFTF